MYNANDLAKATQALRNFSKSSDWQQFSEEWFQGLAKAALDAQYLPAQEPPSERSTRCMIYKKVLND